MFDESQCSREFEEAFASGVGHSSCDCDCGRSHFDGSSDGGWDWEEGEFESLMQLSETHPDRYIAHDGTVRTIYLGGREVVIGCVCDIAKKHERFISLNAMQIAKYLNSRAERILSEAQHIVKTETVKEFAIDGEY